MCNPDRWLENLEDRWAADAFAGDDDDCEPDQPQLDEYGRHPGHPDHGYPGPSIDRCPHCEWTGDALADGYLCPKCGTLTERED